MTQRAAAQNEPEITQSDVAGLLLEVMQWGCQNIDALSSLDLPPEATLHAARQLLTRLDALEQGRLTMRGRQIAQFGSDPRLATMLVAILEAPPCGGDSDVAIAFTREHAAWSSAASSC